MTDLLKKPLPLRLSLIVIFLTLPASAEPLVGQTDPEQDTFLITGRVNPPVDADVAQGHEPITIARNLRSVRCNPELSPGDLASQARAARKAVEDLTKETEKTDRTRTLRRLRTRVAHSSNRQLTRKAKEIEQETATQIESFCTSPVNQVGDGPSPGDCRLWLNAVAKNPRIPDGRRPNIPSIETRGSFQFVGPHSAGPLFSDIYRKVQALGEQRQLIDRMTATRELRSAEEAARRLNASRQYSLAELSQLVKRYRDTGATLGLIAPSSPGEARDLVLATSSTLAQVGGDLDTALNGRCVPIGGAPAATHRRASPGNSTAPVGSGNASEAR